MANLLYNGVSLPAKPPAAGYGVEVIVNVLPAGQSIYGGSAYLFVQGSRLLWQNGKCYVGGIYAVYRLSGDKWVWHYGSGTVSTQDIVAANYFEPLWTNTDIPNANGSGVYLAASEPVDPDAPVEPDEPEEPPVEPETPTVDDAAIRRSFTDGFVCGLNVRGVLKKKTVEEPITADFYLYGNPSESGNVAIAEGEGYTLYSGVVLPKLPEYDESAYPYALIGESVSNSPYELSVADLPMKESFLSHTCSKEASGIDWLFDEDTNEWAFAAPWDGTKGSMGLPKVPAIWANFDVMNSGETAVSVKASKPVALASSEPIRYEGDIPVYQAFGSGGNVPEPEPEEKEWIDDGNTHIWVSLAEGRTSPMLGVRPNGTVTVDWGDGTEPDVLTGTSVWTTKWTPVHNYAKAGDYRITLTVEGEAYLAGTYTTGAYTYILRHSSDVDQRNVAYHGSVQKVEVGNNVFVYAYAFFNCYNMRQIKLLNDSIVESELTFANCYVLESVKLSDNSAHIGSSALSNCYRMCSIEIPGSITTIRSNAFARCYSMKKYDFTSCTAVPTLVNTNAFDNIAPDCEILVPAALAEEWKAATNWATYADYIVGV